MTKSKSSTPSRDPLRQIRIWKDPKEGARCEWHVAVGDPGLLLSALPGGGAWDEMISGVACAMIVPGGRLYPGFAPTEPGSAWQLTHVLHPQGFEPWGPSFDVLQVRDEGNSWSRLATGEALLVIIAQTAPQHVRDGQVRWQVAKRKAGAV